MFRGLVGPECTAQLLLPAGVGEVARRLLTFCGEDFFVEAEVNVLVSVHLGAARTLLKRFDHFCPGVFQKVQMTFISSIRWDILLGYIAVKLSYMKKWFIIVHYWL